MKANSFELKYWEVKTSHSHVITHPSLGVRLTFGTNISQLTHLKDFRDRICVSVRVVNFTIVEISLVLQMWNRLVVWVSVILYEKVVLLPERVHLCMGGGGIHQLPTILTFKRNLDQIFLSGRPIRADWSSKIDRLSYRSVELNLAVRKLLSWWEKLFLKTLIIN